ncbi:uncharacterized protein LOC119654674 isoform X2 [Hermetia illucens]|uniref:uncharacterized protein LOC119654674 isoform X2 n=1 Tax=Hermetia illucens TaxID=343691 RepID=UPI0018CC34EC|nr:uncharacterized protein LOC119654674 isoform X2 [Hermetia illucens]
MFRGKTSESSFNLDMMFPLHLKFLVGYFPEPEYGFEEPCITVLKSSLLIFNAVLWRKRMIVRFT